MKNHDCAAWTTVLQIVVFICCGSANAIPGQEPSAPSAQGRKDTTNRGTNAAVEPAASPIRVARPQELREKSLSGEYHFYLGTLHAHSGYSGDHAKTVATKLNHGIADYSRHQPAEVFAKAKTNFFDFYCITDHSSPEQNEYYRNGFTDEHWAATRQQATAATTPRFLALRGFEFSRNKDPNQGGLGHMSVIGSADWISAYGPGHTFAWLYDWMGTQTNSIVVAQFNHPQLPQSKAGKHFNNYAWRTRVRNEYVRLAEIWNSTTRLGYVPVVQKIWALGWKVAPTAGTDLHGPVGMEKRMLRTGVLAEELTERAILRGLQERRAYATVEPLLHFEFTLNGFEMGSALKQRPPGDMTASVFANDPGGSTISRVDIYGGTYERNGGAVEKVSSLTFGEGKKAAEGVVPGGYDFYYAALFKKGVATARAFTSPIWMDDD